MKVRVLVAVAIGYVVGARAGRARYDEIVRAVREFVESDLVQQLRAEVIGAGKDATRAATLTPPVIVGRGPSGTTPHTRVDLPDVEPSTAGSAASSGTAELGRAKRLDPPAG